MSVLEDIVLAGPQQRALRVVALVAACGFLVIVPASGGVFHPVFSAVAVLLAVLVAAVPESNAALGLLVYLGVLWAIAAPGRLDLWTLAAALDLLVLHLACTLASYGPSGLSLDRDLLRLWRGRFVVCAAAAVLVWAAAGTVRFLDLPASGTAVALALVALLGWVSFLTVRLAQGQDG